MSMPKAFYSYLENEDKLNILSDEQAGRLYKSLYAYARTGEKPDLSDDPLVAYAFADFVIDVDRDFENYADMCAKRSEAGKKSGESRRKKSDDEQTRTKRTSVNFVQQNTNKNEQTRTNANKTNETEAEAEAEANTTNVVKEKNKKEKYGEFDNVLLSKEEFEKLKATFPSDWRDRIERLSQYLAQTGKRYKSHYATILAWARKDKPPDKPESKVPSWRRGGVYSAENASFDLEKYAKRSVFDD